MGQFGRVMDSRGQFVAGGVTAPAAAAAADLSAVPGMSPPPPSPARAIHVLAAGTVCGRALLAAGSVFTVAGLAADHLWMLSGSVWERRGSARVRPCRGRLCLPRAIYPDLIRAIWIQ